MASRLPEFIDPLTLADGHFSLEGIIPVGCMSRLSGLLSSDASDIEVHLEFGIDERGIRYVRGQFTTTVQVLCQRCLEPMWLAINTDTHLALVQGQEEAEQLPECYEPLILTADAVRLVDIVEDDLLLALPFAPTHAAEMCEPGILGSNEGPALKKSPFAILADISVKKHDG